MSTINLQDIKGNELLEDYADFVKTVAMEARATVSVDKGSLQKSTMIRRSPDGFVVFVKASKLRELSKERKYYARQYSEKGYVRWEAFPYIDKAFETISGDDNASVGKRNVWRAKYKSGRRGSGQANDDSMGADILTAFTNKRGFTVNIPRRIRK